MRNGARIAVIIPVLNEAASIGYVLEAIPAWVDDIIVADNGSQDATGEIAKAHGARVVVEPRRGYGSACLKGMEALDKPDVVVFLDGDFSDHPEQMDRLVDPIVEGRYDVVIGSRVLGHHEPGALTPQARFGNRLACFLMRLIWGVQYTDLGPFRAVRYSTLRALNMADRDYGWTVELQIKAAMMGVASTERPVDYRKRAVGRSKVSGTLRGIVGAGYKILTTIALAGLRSRFAKAKPSERLVVFTRIPKPGEAKTRLIPALGAEGAAELQRQMTERMLATARQLEAASVEVRFTGGSREAVRAWLGDDVGYRPQGPGDLGDRMGSAFSEAFENGVERVVIAGTDCPDLSRGVLRAAFRALRKHDIVLGPATDGGYYLIGLRRGAGKRAIPAVFENMEWGTDRVFDETVARLNTQGLRLCCLAPLDDVDRPEDVAVWERVREASSGDPSRSRISVIVPALNEAKNLHHTLASAQGADDVEIIVVDGGSDDGTPDRARELGAVVESARRGRAAQMNLGSAKATGGILLFLHADTRLPEGFELDLRKTLDEPGTVAGAFRFGTDDVSRSMRLIAVGANLRSRYLQLPYGDQALFVRKDVFREIGGYPEIPFMEDFVMVRRLSRLGRIRLAPSTVTTSARRWQRVGPWRTFAYNLIAVTAYLLGIPPARIAKFYNRRRGVS